MRYILNIVQIIIIVIVSLVLFSTAILIGLFSKKTMHFIGIKMWAPILVFIVGGKTTIKGKENVDPTRPCIYVANHSSHFDIPVLFASFDFFLHFIAKKELKKIPFLGWANTMAGTLWIDRKNKISAMNSMKKAGEIIKNEGKNVLTFPEGTRSKDGNIAMFRKGTFVLAKNAGIDIVPIGLIGTRPLNPPGTISMRPSKVTLIIGERIAVSDFENRTAEEFAKYTEEKVIELLQNK